MQIEGIIFDLDGTLLDSMKVWDSIGEDYLLSLGIKPRENLKEVFKDMSLIQSAQYYQQHYHVNKTIDEIIDGINKLIEDFYINKVQLKKGARAFLEELSRKNIKMIIATATDKYLVDAALLRLGIREYFIGVLTCNEVGYGKDKPVIFEEALRRLNTNKLRTVVFEDAVYAIKTAKEAGFIVSGVYDESEDQKLVKELSDFYIKEYKKMEDFYENSFNDSWQ